MSDASTATSIHSSIGTNGETRLPRTPWSNIEKRPWNADFVKRLRASRGRSRGRSKIHKKTRKHKHRDSPIERVRRIDNRLQTMPIYLVLCHGMHCANYAACEVPSRSPVGETLSSTPKFHIPSNTYILNFTSGSSICMFGQSRAFALRKMAVESYNLTNLLLIDDIRDIPLAGAQSHHRFLSSVTRAAPHSTYPNLLCTFRDTKVPNDNGVYELLDAPFTSLDAFVNENSIISKDEKGPHPTEKPEYWFLDEIIKETYKRKKINRGIFILAMCSEGESLMRPELLREPSPIYKRYAKIAEKVNDAVINTIRVADLKFSRRSPTFDLQTLNDASDSKRSYVPFDVGITSSIAYPNTTHAATFARHMPHIPIEKIFPEMVNYSARVKEAEALRKELDK